MLSHHKVLRLIDSIHDAAADSDRWQAFLEQFAEAVDGTITTLMYHDMKSLRASLMATARGDPEAERRYMEYYRTRDVYRAAWRARTRRERKPSTTPIVVANWWRAVKYDPDGVADYADWPVNEADVFARHNWLTRRERFREIMMRDPLFQAGKARIASPRTSPTGFTDWRIATTRWGTSGRCRNGCRGYGCPVGTGRAERPSKPPASV